VPILFRARQGFRRLPEESRGVPIAEVGERDRTALRPGTRRSDELLLIALGILEVLQLLEQPVGLAPVAILERGNRVRAQPIHPWIVGRRRTPQRLDRLPLLVNDLDYPDGALVRRDVSFPQGGQRAAHHAVRGSELRAQSGHFRVGPSQVPEKRRQLLQGLGALNRDLCAGSDRPGVDEGALRLDLVADGQRRRDAGP